MLAAVDIFMHI